jgi:hypothetical protein
MVPDIQVTRFGLVDAMTLSAYISPTAQPSAMAKWLGISLRVKWPQDQGVFAIAHWSLVPFAKAPWFALQPLEPLSSVSFLFLSMAWVMTYADMHCVACCQLPPR